MIRHPRALGAASAAAALLLLVILPAVVAAHSELEKSSPADGTVVEGSPAEIVLTFSETLDPKKSSISLRDAGGQELASARVDPADDTVMRLTPPTLAAGAYEIRWTSVAEDGDLLRGTVHFEVATPATPSPTVEPSESASAAPTASAPPTVAPSPSPSAAGSPTGSSSDVILPILAAIVLIAVLGAWLLRNRARGTRP